MMLLKYMSLLKELANISLVQTIAEIYGLVLIKKRNDLLEIEEVKWGWKWLPKDMKQFLLQQQIHLTMSKTLSFPPSRTGYDIKDHTLLQATAQFVSLKTFYTSPSLIQRSDLCSHHALESGLWNVIVWTPYLQDIWYSIILISGYVRSFLNVTISTLKIYGEIY